MIDFDHAIISSLFDCVDQVGANLVSDSYHNLVVAYSPFIWTMTAIYMGFLFLQAQQGAKSFYDFMNATFKAVVILTLALNYNYFCLFIYDIVTKEPLEVLKAIAVHGSDTGPATINQALDHYLNLGLAYANKLFLMGGWSNLTYFIFALLVFVMTILGSVFAAGLIILSKCAAVVLLALSPLFLFFALFEMTKGLCQSYVRHLITYALVPVIASAVLMILFSVDEYVIHFMDQFPKATFKAIAPFLFMCGVQIYLLAQVYSKAAALGAGFALASFMPTLSKAKDNMKAAANVMTGGLLGGRDKNATVAPRASRFRNPKPE
jgi:type IV secretory pathway VirB6-like protein